MKRTETKDMHKKIFYKALFTSLSATTIYYILTELFSRDVRNIFLNLISSFICFAILFVLLFFLFSKKKNKHEDVEGKKRVNSIAVVLP